LRHGNRAMTDRGCIAADINRRDLAARHPSD
jgi:hypothetical protein